QHEMETQIDENINLTRQRLLENFDEEVTEKLRINLKESKEYLTKYEDQLWDLTKYCLRDCAEFSGTEHSFTLKKNPFSEEKINPGPYRIGKNVTEGNIYRIGHPLAQRIIEKYKNISLPEQELVFDYSGRKISRLESLVGKTGWLSFVNLTISAFETEDHLLYCGVSEDGVALDIEQCQRLFSLPAIVNAEVPEIQKELKDFLAQIANNQQVDILKLNAEKNAGFFDTEMTKLDKWAEDIKNSIEIELKLLDKDIRFRKTEAKKLLNLEEKVKTQRQIKEMEKKRNNLRQELYKSQDEVDVRKEQLITDIEARMKQNVERYELFRVRWKVK
ncbi:MAG TPA: DEAD/DEAH box helicase, partial [Bacillota bacterium]|nr:DEAD/DEAH box helicase [Bacillota bacterium]